MLDVGRGGVERRRCWIFLTFIEPSFGISSSSIVSRVLSAVVSSWSATSTQRRRSVSTVAYRSG
ncbi:hypothetical protein [Kineosporia mesophila]|uniref:hypothetical protein n=1 Tax=Kineosporia mesophila TaxID=566012 RepID=UPI001E4FFBEE|nr:hypothetical protein [Kineosporia mesophila]MCD5350777.1 hypothetical protein [Kineosporia mesophila]